jgi:hypothetical protein
MAIGTHAAASSDANLFADLYNKIEKMVIPQYDPSVGSPTQVILFEMPGVAVNRDEYDNTAWAAGGYLRRQPDAILAQFVDRLPYYTGPTFVDSGSKISTLWGFFMYQYIIPIVDDPVQVQKVNDARAALANGTLQTTYNTASAAYEVSFNEFTSFRTNCLGLSTSAAGSQGGPGVCAAQGVIYRERLKRKWFSLEVARRDIAAAESKIIALQVQDLKNIFAEQLYAYANNERTDMGSDGFGQTYYQTFATPSNFWRWWPSTGIFDYSVSSDGTGSTVTVPAGGTITQTTGKGTLVAVGSTNNFTYTPNLGVTGVDSFVYRINNTAGAGSTKLVTVTIGIVGNDVVAADTAFVRVTSSSSESSKDEKKSTSKLDASIEASGSYGLFSASGSASTSISKSRESLVQTGSTFSVSFELARVLITRPWLDTAVLSFYPVAIRNLAKNGWSDGTIAPAPGPLAFKFKLLPVAFLVARNIEIKSTFSKFQTDLQTETTDSKASVKVGYGPFFSGSASASYASSDRNYKESSSVKSDGISIRGPQVIAWVCTPIPPFPTSDEPGVRAWEADQVKRQKVASS